MQYLEFDGRAALTTIVLSLALTTAGAAAQAPGGRVIPLPDTLGAAFSIADSATRAGNTSDYDFLVGLWEFRFQSRQPDGTYQRPFTGHWSAQKRNVPGGLIEDHWRSDNPNATWDSGTYSYRAWSPTRKLWTFQGVDTNDAAWSPGISWSDGTTRYVVQHYDGFMMRSRYFNITPMSFLWRADISRDNGVTWILDWWIMDARRIAK